MIAWLLDCLIAWLLDWLLACLFVSLFVCLCACVHVCMCVSVSIVVFLHNLQSSLYHHLFFSFFLIYLYFLSCTACYTVLYLLSTVTFLSLSNLSCHYFIYCILARYGLVYLCTRQTNGFVLHDIPIIVSTFLFSSVRALSNLCTTPVFINFIHFLFPPQFTLCFFFFFFFSVFLFSL